ncbi:TadE/TadG family type IV pilus assembly protein [Novosphingobium aquae]|uniref:TadE/TadG family type IV pilus assembly protein n=1 Tax=Novosphingobium aquae TaxID=3133435 RepID=A0ABU8S4V7_9SPHN
MRFLSGRDMARQAARFIARLSRDQAGNTLMIVAFSLVPILAMIGGGIDMGRGYLSQSRLQQACDAGVLAARKKLANTTVSGAIPPVDVKTVGDRFFTANFKTGSYGTGTRKFQMAIEPDKSVSGNADVKVPTTLMALFGFRELNIAVTCQAKVSFSNTDVMMVLDVTGSMNETNPGDTKSRIKVLRDVVKSFHSQLEKAKSTGARMRYGFVPYATNVNVGYLLKSGWMVDKWTYEGREAHDTGLIVDSQKYQTKNTYESGTFSYGSTYDAPSCPAGGLTWNTINNWTDPDGTENWRVQIDGTDYNCETSGEGDTTITPFTYVAYTYVYSQKPLGTVKEKLFDWHYRPISVDVSTFKSVFPDLPPVGGKLQLDMGGIPSKTSKIDARFNGCIEERKTYDISDYANVDLSKALDLDIDMVPVDTDPDTQWKPQLPEISWERSLTWTNYSLWNWTPNGDFYQGDFINAGANGFASCPKSARKLAEMTNGEVSTYLDSLTAAGNTYHDIGMIWGGRLLSPTGLFASENADTGGVVTNRHLIFLTDGLTMPNELSYGAYGLESLSRRRWSPSSQYTLTKVVENRLAVACKEIKKKNISVWVIGFGVALNPTLTDCAGKGHYFEASNAASLYTAFDQIIGGMGDLRISK